MKKIILFLGYTTVILVSLFLFANYLFYGTPYSTEKNCNKIETGDSFTYVIWKLGIPSYIYKKDNVRVFGYPIPIASYAKVPKNEISFFNNKVVSKVCAGFN